jgi:SAM-dependent methyltransferase
VAGFVWWRRRGRGGHWYRFVYRTAYRIGFTPWDRGVPAPELTGLLEGPSALPPGRALDIGCGAGVNSIYLAQHGWAVTGVDLVPEALAAARRRAETAGVTPTFLLGDVTRLEELGLDGDFTLLVDVGCFHTLPSDQRDAYVAGVSAVASSASTFVLYGFGRGRFAPMEAGVTPDEVRERFHGWEVVEAQRVPPKRLLEQAGGSRQAARAAAWFQLWWFLLRRLPRSPDRSSSAV